MPRFVILRHEVPASFRRGSHWDLMLEQAADLMAWSLPEIPRPQRTVAAEPLAPHRKTYLDYEGPVSGNRGHVRQWDDGQLFWIEQHADRVVVRLEGKRLRGTVTLQRRDRQDTAWDLTYLPESPATLESIDESPADGKPPLLDA